MKTMESIMAMMAQGRNNASKRIEKNKHSLFDALDAKGVSSVNVTFDGSGDSGGVEEINLEASKGVDKNKVLTTVVDGVQVYEGTQFSPEGITEIFSDKPATVNDIIESICYDALKVHHEGWENNDGAYGELNFYCDNREITMVFHERQITSHEYEF
jgi:hypothetical protein